MLAAADEVLKALGMQDRQALIIEHKDTKHPHVHLIVNRVSPETGLYAKVGNDRLTLSRCAVANYALADIGPDLSVALLRDASHVSLLGYRAEPSIFSSSQLHDRTRCPVSERCS